jgi:hypothetical protein
VNKRSPFVFLGNCFQSLGLAVVGTTLILFFTDIGMWPLLLMTLIGVTIFYAGWFLGHVTFTKKRG